MGALLDIARLAAGPSQSSETNQSDALGNPPAEARRQQVLEMLGQNRTARYAFQTELEADPEAVLLTFAIRGKATCELRIPRAKYDGFLLLDLVRRHSGTVSLRREEAEAGK